MKEQGSDCQQAQGSSPVSGCGTLGRSLEKSDRKCECFMHCVLVSREDMHILIAKAMAMRKERTLWNCLIPAFPTPVTFSTQEEFTEHLHCAWHCSGNRD